MSLQNTLQPYAIQGAAMLLTSFVGHQVWVDAKMFVTHAADTTLSNVDKHAVVKKDMLMIFGDIGQSFLDVIIKLAVMWLNTQLVNKVVPNAQ
tara:strand:- start:476 stop:754 length:279 start_codon:yes stop_codon:yes gene_type:complete